MQVVWWVLLKLKQRQPATATRDPSPPRPALRSVITVVITLVATPQLVPLSASATISALLVTAEGADRHAAYDVAACPDGDGELPPQPATVHALSARTRITTPERTWASCPMRERARAGQAD